MGSTLPMVGRSLIIGDSFTLTLIYRLTQFVITKALPYIFTSLGYGTWFFFASWMLLATIWAFFFLPETKGKTLDEIDIIL
jgi:hypothetical protein